MYHGQMNLKWSFYAEMGPIISSENLATTVKLDGGSVMACGQTFEMA